MVLGRNAKYSAGRGALLTELHYSKNEETDFHGLPVSGSFAGNLFYNTGSSSEDFNQGLIITSPVVTAGIDNSMLGPVGNYSTLTSIVHFEATGLKDILPELLLGTASLGLVSTSLVLSAVSQNPSALLISFGLTLAFSIGLVGAVITARKR